MIVFGDCLVIVFLLCFWFLVFWGVFFVCCLFVVLLFVVVLIFFEVCGFGFWVLGLFKFGLIVALFWPCVCNSCQNARITTGTDHRAYRPTPAWAVRFFPRARGLAPRAYVKGRYLKKRMRRIHLRRHFISVFCFEKTERTWL